MSKGKGQGQRRIMQLAAKRSRKEQAASHPSGRSKYARKKEYLARTGEWGFNIPHPKPWA